MMDRRPPMDPSSVVMAPYVMHTQHAHQCHLQPPTEQAGVVGKLNHMTCSDLAVGDRTSRTAGCRAALAAYW